MFKLASLDNLTIPVPLAARIGLADGSTTPVEFTTHCRVLADESIAELARSGDRALLKAVVVDWEGVVADDGSPLAFDAEQFDAVLAYACIRVALIGAYYEAVARAARKN